MAKDLSAIRAAKKVLNRRGEMDERAKEVLSPGVTHGKLNNVHAGSNSSSKKRDQKHTITAPKKTNKKHFGRPFNEGK